MTIHIKQMSVIKSLAMSAAFVVMGALTGCGGSDKEEPKVSEAIIADDNGTTSPVTQPVAPTVNAGADITVDSGHTFNLAAVAADSDGTVVTYEWSQLGGMAVIINAANSASASAEAPVLEGGASDQVLSFQVKVTDNDGNVASDTVSVIVSAPQAEPENQAPVADAQSEPSVYEGQQAILDGSGSQDSDGTIVAYSWVQTGGTAVNLSGADTLEPSFIAPEVNATTALTFELEVMDDDGAVSLASVSLDVLNQAESNSAHKVSRTSGLAPLTVHFEADVNASTDSSQNFHNLDYTWDFGDDDNAVWSISGKSKNLAKGAIAAHVFEAPGTYTVTLKIADDTGVLEVETFHIYVHDPDRFYAGDKTIVVSDSASANFAGAPAGSVQIVTDDLNSIASQVTAGKRLLLARGSEWTSGQLSFPNSSGPVTIGAFGNGAKPKVNITSGNFVKLDGKQDWRIMDVSLSNAAKNTNAFSGMTDVQDNLILRVDTTGFTTAVSLSVWNGGELLPMARNAVVDGHFTEFSGYGFYLGGEQLVLMGNYLDNPSWNHTARVWQAYKSVIQHNMLTKAGDTHGKHVLKLHGPDETKITNTLTSGNGNLRKRTGFTIVSDNVFSGNGPWAVTIGPQNAQNDERLTDMIIERNRFTVQYGEKTQLNHKLALMANGRFFSIRNNIIDGTGGHASYTGISVTQRGAEPAPKGVHVYNNTVYRGDNETNNNQRIGIRLGANVIDAKVKNNIVSFPESSRSIEVVANETGNSVVLNNLQVPRTEFMDPEHSSPMDRNFSLMPGALSINQSVDVEIYDDFQGNERDSLADMGAIESNL